jgi:hypothetical protein
MARIWKSYYGGENRRKKQQMSVSIGRGGLIRLNRTAMAALGDPQAVELKFDDKDSVIGVLPSTPRNDHAFTVIEKPSAWFIQAAPFCRNFGISVDKTERFDEPQLDDEGVLCLDLKRTHVVSVPRKRK